MNNKKNSSRPGLSSLAKLFSTSRAAGTPKSGHFEFERLEDRTNPSTLSIIQAGGNFNVTYTGTAGADTLQISAVGTIYTLNSSDNITVVRDDSGTTTGSGTPTVQYDAFLVSNFTVNMGGSADTVNFLSMCPLDVMIINGDDGNDVINVPNSPGGRVSLNGNANDDTFVLGNAVTLIPINVGGTVIDGGTGLRDHLNLSAYTTGRIVNLGTGTAVGIGNLANIEDVTGGSANDILDGNTANNILIGGNSFDFLTGNTGDDTMIGGLGDDTYFFDDVPGGVLETDTIVELANEGTDSLNFLSTTIGVVVNLNNNPPSFIAQQLDRNVLTGGVGQAANFENVVGGDGDDLIIGNAANNNFSGFGGNDTMVDGQGNDTMSGQSGDDLYVFVEPTGAQNDAVLEVANAGIDTLDFSAMFSAVTINITGNTGSGGGRSLSMAVGTNFENVTGGSGDDNITGNASANILIGNAGNDTISGVDGNDTITGGAGNDSLNGGNGADTFLFTANSGADDDTVTAGAGLDTLDFLNADTGPTTVGVAVNLNLTTLQIANAFLNLTLTDAPSSLENIIGGNGDDTFTGNGLSNSLVGGVGNDTFRFDADTAQGTDTIVAGAGTDTLDFQNSVSSGPTTAAITVDLTNVAAQIINANLTLVLSDATTDLENVTAGEGNDTITDNNLGNTLIGGLGDDTFIFVSTSANQIDQVEEDPGEGIDSLIFQGTFPVNVDLSIGLATVTNAGLGVTRTVNIVNGADFERVTTGTGDDTIIGNGADNTLNGGSGNDFINGLGGNDSIDGLAGSDTLIGDTGNDTLNGGANDDFLNGGIGDDSMSGGSGNDTYFLNSNIDTGNDTIVDSVGSESDTIDFSAGSTGITIDLTVGGAQVLTPGITLTGASGLENVNGSQGNDVITGNGVGNIIQGNGGDDLMIGAAGDDTFVFNATFALGSDTVTAGAGIDTLDFSLSTQNITVDLTNAALQVVAGGNLQLTLTDAPTDLENVNGGLGNDDITGNNLANLLVGGLGADTFEGLGGNDTLIGGPGDDTYIYDADVATGSDLIDESGGGFDTLDFSPTTTVGITIDLSASGPQTVAPGVEIEITPPNSVERVIGGDGNDFIRGTPGNDTLIGGGGNDTIEGIGGNDVLDGGADDDTYVFDTDNFLGHDTIVDIAGNDTLDFSPTQLVNVAVNLGLASQVVNGNLQLTLAPANSMENVIGGDANDTITGNASNNSLVGGAGNDTFVFNTNTAQGSDTVVAGGGTDTLDFSPTTTATITVNLSNAAAQAVNGNLTLELQDGPVALENVIGGALGDSITGNALANAITGGEGSDAMAGLAGDDTYIFNTALASQTDTVIEAAAAGSDTLFFGSLGANDPVTVNLLTDVNTAVHTNRVVNVVNAANMENAFGGAGNDSLVANGANNLLAGGAGDDRYVFDADIALGSDVVNETGGGIDTIDFSLTTTVGVTLNMGLTGAQTVNGNLVLTLAGEPLENAVGGDLGDNFTGNSLNNTLIGGFGNDTLAGAAGNDLLIGGAGDDRYIITDILDTDFIEETAGGGIDTLDATAATRQITFLIIPDAQAPPGAESVTFDVDFMEFVLFGSGDDFAVFGDRATLANGNGFLDGGPGFDTLDYSRYTVPFGVDLATGQASGTGGIANFEAVVGPPDNPRGDVFPPDVDPDSAGVEGAEAAASADASAQVGNPSGDTADDASTETPPEDVHAQSAGGDTTDSSDDPLADDDEG